MKVISAMLRHSSITITADTYPSVVPEVARAAAAAIVPLTGRVKKSRAAHSARKKGASGTPRLPRRENTTGRSLHRKNAQVR